MLEKFEWFLVIAVVLISFTILIIVLSVGPCCHRSSTNKDGSWNKMEYIASWNRNNDICYHDSFSVATPPLPPYFFMETIGYNSFIESV